MIFRTKAKSKIWDMIWEILHFFFVWKKFLFIFLTGGFFFIVVCWNELKFIFILFVFVIFLEWIFICVHVILHFGFVFRSM